MSVKTANVWLVVVVLAVTAFLYAYSYTFAPSILPDAPQPSLFPRFALWITGGSAIGIASLMIKGGEKNEENEESISISPIPLLFVVGVGICYMLLVDKVGFELTSFGSLIVLLYVTTRRLLQSAVLSLAGTVTCYVIFVLLLSVHIPTLFLPQYLSEIF